MKLNITNRPITQANISELDNFHFPNGKNSLLHIGNLLNNMVMDYYVTYF